MEKVTQTDRRTRQDDDPMEPEALPYCGHPSRGGSSSRASGLILDHGAVQTIPIDPNAARSDRLTGVVGDAAFAQADSITMVGETCSSEESPVRTTMSMPIAGSFPADDDEPPVEASREGEVEEEEDCVMKGVMDLRDVVREARTSMIHNSDGALSFLEGFDDVVETIASCASNFGDGDVMIGVVGEDDDGTPLSVFEKKVIADRHLHRRMMSRDGRQTFSRALQSEAAMRAKRRRSNISIPASHPVHLILPYVPHLHAVFLKMSNKLSWLTDSGSSIEQKAVASRFVHLLEYMSDQVSSILTLLDDDPSLFNDAASMSGARNPVETSSDAMAFDTLFFGDADDAVCQKSTATSTSGDAYAAITTFRLVLAVCADGSSLTEKAHEEATRREIEERDSNCNGLMLFHDEMEEMVKLDGGIGLLDDNSMNQRGALAAMKLGKLNVSQVLGASVGNCKTADDLSETSLDVLKDLMEWMANVDIVLTDLTGSTTTAVIRCRTSDGRYDGVDYLLRTTIPEILSVGSLDATENITAIVAAFIRKKRKIMELIPKRETEDEVDEIADEEKELPQSQFLLKAQEFISRSKLRRYLPRSKKKKLTVLLSGAMLIMRCAYAMHPTIGMALATLMVVLLTRRFLDKHYDYTRSEASKHANDFLPQLPERCVPREELQSRTIHTMLNSKDHMAKGETSASTHGSTDNNTTILSGAPGTGKTTIANLVVRDPLVRGGFPDGIVWLSFDMFPRLTYKTLIQKYHHICKQLAIVSQSRKVAALASSFDVEQYYLQSEDEAEDEIQLMNDLRRDFFAQIQVGTRQFLFILDGMHDLSDMDWFRSGNQPEKGRKLAINKQHNSRSHILVTTTATVQRGKDSNHHSHWSRMVETGLLTDEEAKAILANELITTGQNIKIDKSVARGRDWAYFPLSLRCIGRVVSSRDIVYEQTGTNMGVEPSSTAILMNRLAALSQRTYASEEELSLGIVKESLNHLFANMGGVGDVMRLCFCAFASLFFDQSSPECLLMEPYIPVNIAHIFWDGLLKSEEIPVEDLVDLERCLVPQESNGGTLMSRSAFIADRLVALGLLKSIPRDCGYGKMTRVGFSLGHEVLSKVAPMLEGADFWENEDVLGNRQAWSVTLVHAYQEYLSGIGSRRDRSKKDDGHEEVQHFIMRYIVKHMLLGGMGDKALELWSNESFFQNRMRRLGSLDATTHHIADADFLLELLKHEGEFTTLSGRSVHMSSAKMAIIASFERIANHLAQVPGDFIEDFVKASASLFLLGQSLLKQKWNNEAFVLFQESVSLCHVVLTYKRRGHAVVYRILARALFHIGGIHEDKGDLVEAIKSFSESLHYASNAPSGYKSIALDVMRTLHSLGNSHFQNGDVRAALKAHNRLLVAVEASFGRQHLRYADALQNIGLIHIKNRDAEKARILFADALGVRRLLIRAESPDIAANLHFLGIAHRDLGNTSMALKTLKEAVSVWEKIIAADNAPKNQVNYASTLHDLGLLHRQRGELEEALHAYNEALRLRQSFLGEGNEETAQTLHNLGIVYCDKGAHEEALMAYARSLQRQKSTSQSPRSPQSQQDHSQDEDMKSFTNALWSSQALRKDAPTVRAIKERCAHLFGTEIEKQACTSARIFACSSLMVDRMIKDESPDGQSSTFDKSDTSLMDWITPMLPFMIAAVKAEMAVGLETLGEEKEAGGSTRKIVRFCSFDFSAVTAPVDMAVGSNEPLERSIDALRKVTKEVQQLSYSDASTSQKDIGEKAKLLLVLYAMTTPIEGKAMREACAQAMPNDNGKPWPPSRFLRAAELYRTELESIIASNERIHEGGSAIIPSPSPLRERLSTQIGSALRFHLRRLFDPLPMFFTMPSDKYEPPDLSDCRARTHEIVSLRPPAGVETKGASDGSDGPAPLWDRPISHVLNLALQRTYAYLQMLDEIKESLTVEGDPTKGSASLTLSQASKRCLEGRSKDKSVSEVDVDDILRDVHIAHTCLSATRASKFILSLLRWPGVAEAIEEAGGWQPIESLAGTLRHLHLERDFPDEAHFSQLENVSDLIALLEASRSETMTAARASQKVLQDMWKRFKRGAGKRKRRHTYDSIVRQVLLDDSTTAVFPLLATPGSD